MEAKQSIFEELCLPHLDAAYNLASTLNVPPDTVMSRLGRARQRVRQELEGVRQKALQHEV